MAKVMFAEARVELTEACMVLRSFTLGRRGSSQRGGLVCIQRVNAQCKRMMKLFAEGPYAREAQHLAASARTRVLAAETRLELLRKK